MCSGGLKLSHFRPINTLGLRERGHKILLELLNGPSPNCSRFFSKSQRLLVIQVDHLFLLSPDLCCSYIAVLMPTEKPAKLIVETDV